MYLRGLSTGDFVPALSEFFGSSDGLSPSVITRLTTQWQGEHRAFAERDLTDHAVAAAKRFDAEFRPRVRQDIETLDYSSPVETVLL